VTGTPPSRAAAPGWARRLPFFYGWLVVAGVFVLCVPVAGLAFYGLSVYLRAFTDERGLSIAAVSGATAVSYALSGLIGMLVARRVTRSDPRPLIVVGAVASAAALAGLGRASESWHVYVLYSVLGCATALNSLVIGTTLVTRWFHRRRGTALAIAISGLTAGGLVVAPIASAWIDDLGLSGAMPRLAWLYLALALPFPLLVLRPDPSDLGLRPDGDAAPTRAGGPDPPTSPSWRYEDAVRSRAFLAITATLVFSQLAQVGGIAQLFNAVSSRVDEPTGRLCLMLVTSFGLVGRLAGGPMAHWLGTRRFALACYGAQGFGWLAVGLATTRGSLIAASILTGLTVGNTLLLHPLLLSEYFGPADYARIYAFSQLFVTIGVAGGPFVLGWAHDVAGGYTAAFVLAAVSAGLGALSFLTGWSTYEPADRTAPSLAPRSPIAGAPAQLPT
jgi:MFS family permease